MTDPCELCGEIDRWILEDVPDRVTGEHFGVVRCRRCGFGRTDPVPGSLDRYYPARYRRFGRLGAALLHRMYLRRVDRWLAGLPPSGLALEVGAGTGWMLRVLRERGWRALGSERTAEAASRVRSAAGVPVFVGGIGAVRETPLLDLVVMFHVLEHLSDPLDQLSQTARRLKPGGTLVLGLPNIASWQSRLFGRDWLHLDVPRHLCHFSPDSIERALTLAGLRLTRIDFRSPEHDPLGWTQSALDRLGFEKHILLRILAREERRSGPVEVIAALALSVPLTAIGAILAIASWAARRGAVMEVWAARPER